MLAIRLSISTIYSLQTLFLYSELALWILRSAVRCRSSCFPFRCCETGCAGPTTFHTSREYHDSIDPILQNDASRPHPMTLLAWELPCPRSLLRVSSRSYAYLRRQSTIRWLAATRLGASNGANLMTRYKESRNHRSKHLHNKDGELVKEAASTLDR